MARRSLVDILGEDEPKKRKKKKEESVNDWSALDEGEDIFNPRDFTPTYRGVTVNWLRHAFRMDASTIKKKLSMLTPVSYQRGNTPLFDFVQAASYLVKPKIDLRQYIKNLRPEDLPVDLQKDYWDALTKRQKYMRQAGELWHTSDVIDVFGEAFKHIKTSTQLWVNQLDRQTGLTAEQLRILEKLADQLLDDMHTRLASLKDHRATSSSVEDLPDDVPES